PGSTSIRSTAGNFCVCATLARRKRCTKPSSGSATGFKEVFDLKGPDTGGGLDSALVLFSGGQDSTVCLVWALERFARVETIGFDYGQRHAVELEVRPRLRERLAQ